MGNTKVHCAGEYHTCRPTSLIIGLSTTKFFRPKMKGNKKRKRFLNFLEFWDLFAYPIIGDFLIFWQYFIKRQSEAINGLIEKAILDAEAKGTKVLSLGLLNQASLRGKFPFFFQMSLWSLVQYL